MKALGRREFLTVCCSGIATAVVAACSDSDDEGKQATSASPTVRAGTDASAAGLRWFGQSMFLLTSPGGTRILLDPFSPIGYALPPPIEAAAATISHEHPDHSNAALAVPGTPVLRGLTSDGWTQIDQRVGDVRIFTVNTYHDAASGAQRGRNAIFVFESAGLRVAHLGDLGHPLNDQQARSLGGPVDVLMVPVGGGPTIDAALATDLVNQLKPKLVFPMHYKTPAIPFALATVDEFLIGKKVQRVGSNTSRLSKDTLPSEATVAVLDYT